MVCKPLYSVVPQVALEGFAPGKDRLIINISVHQRLFIGRKKLKTEINPSKSKCS